MSIHSCQPCFVNWPLNQTPTFVTENGEKKINHFKNASHFDVERLTNVLFFLELNKCKPNPRCEQGSFFNWDLRLSKLGNASEKEVFFWSNPLELRTETTTTRCCSLIQSGKVFLLKRQVYVERMEP